MVGQLDVAAGRYTLERQTHLLSGWPCGIPDRRGILPKRGSSDERPRGLLSLRLNRGRHFLEWNAWSPAGQKGVQSNAGKPKGRIVGTKQLGQGVNQLVRV